MASISQIVKKFVGAPFGNLNESLVNSIPLNTSGRVNGATWNYGFPQITMQPVDNGGKPPSGMDFNGVFNVLSTILYNSQLGIVPNEYNSGTSYPMGAVVVYPPDGSTDKSMYVSLIDNNTYSPTDTNSWKAILRNRPFMPNYSDWHSLNASGDTVVNVDALGYAKKRYSGDWYAIYIDGQEVAGCVDGVNYMKSFSTPFLIPAGSTVHIDKSSNLTWDKLGYWTLS